jgi:hypothetical protein
VRLRIFIVIQALLFLIAVAAVIRIFSKDVNGPYDFHCFWNGGNFIWQGTDPYRAFLDKLEVRLPLRYLDGITITEGPIHPFKVSCVPGNTAPVVFLISPLARFSWPTASRIWNIVNLLLSIAVVWILLEIFNISLFSHGGVLLLSLFILQTSTREALECGQTSLLIVFCMFASMLLSYRDRTPMKAIASGLLLGLAISKPLLAFPVLLLFLIRRRGIEVLAAAAVQIVGVWCISLLGTRLPAVMSEYVQIFMMHAGPGAKDGMYLTAGLLEPWIPYSYLVIASGTAVFVFILLKWFRTSVMKTDLRTDTILLTVVMFWNLLIFYHRRYDFVAAGAFLAFMICFFADAAGSVWRSTREKRLVYGFAGVLVTYWIIPAYRILGQMAYRSLFNLCTITGLVLSTWILFRLNRGRPTRLPFLE